MVSTCMYSNTTPNKKDLVILDDTIENTIPNFYERFNGAHV